MSLHRDIWNSRICSQFWFYLSHSVVSLISDNVDVYTVSNSLGGTGTERNHWPKKKDWIELLLFRKLAVAILLGPPWDPITHVCYWEENNLDATRKRNVIPLNSEEGTFFLNVILPMTYSKLHGESGPNKMAPLASILWEREQWVALSSLFWDQWEKQIVRTGWMKLPFLSVLEATRFHCLVPWWSNS